jgi:hypothetical protein
MIRFLSQALLMTKLTKLVILFVLILLLIYVSPKSPDFPKPPIDSVQSGEPADIETLLRRGYYTNLSRVEVINHYKKEFNNGFNVYTPRLNYPPEDAPLLIRDQTKSTFLEEIVHPLRESIYINGFEPKTEEYAQYYKGIRYNQKIIVRYVPSPVWIRIVILLLSATTSYYLIIEYLNAKKQN